MKIEHPLKLGGGLNDRLHYMVRAKKVKKERELVAWLLVPFARPATPVTFKLTRISKPSATGFIPLDRDNLFGAFKSVRDAIAKWMGVDDRDETLVSYEYHQEPGANWGVRIEWE